MSVHYKFKSALEYDTVTFDGLHISVRDLKNAIIQQKRIGKNTDFDLQVTNAQTKEVYEDEEALIPKNTSLLIARIPLVATNKSKTWEGYGGDSTPAARSDEGGPIAKAVDLSSLDASEDDKIRAMMSQSTQDYDPSNYMKIRGANQVGVVPPNYRCYKCHQSGHWIKDCPLSQGPEPMEIKKSTGIPRSFMVPVDGPQVQGAMMTPNGGYAVPVLDHQTYTQKQQPAPPPMQEEQPDIPEDLVCSICSGLLSDAVMIPCCGNSFCDECIRSCLLESEEHECPDCHERDISPGTLIPNRYLRNSVANFKNTTGYVKRPVYKPQSIKQIEIEKQEPDIPKSPESKDTAEVVKSEISEKTVISEADSTEAPKSIGNTDFSKEIEVKVASKDSPTKSLVSEGPPGVSPRREKSPKRISHRKTSHHSSNHNNGRNRRSSKDMSPRRRNQRRSPQYDHLHRIEERSGTPTVDEPGMSGNLVGGNNGYPQTNAPYPSGPPPGILPPMMGMPPPHMQAPPPSYPSGQPPPGVFSQPQGPPPNFRLPPPGANPPYMPGPYNPGPRPLFDPTRPPIQGPPPTYPNYPPRSRSRDYNASRMRTRTPPGIIDDPLEAFNRMLREKDERERRAKQRKGRSYSRSSSRSYSRSPKRARSRSPRRRTSRSRSRSFSISRSRSRSFSPSPRNSPYRDYSPRNTSPRRRPPSRYRSPLRSPPRYRYKDAPPLDRNRDRDYDRSNQRDRDRGYSRDRDFNYYDRDRGRWGGSASRPVPENYYAPEVHPLQPANRYHTRDSFQPYMNKTEPPHHIPPLLPTPIHINQRRFDDVAPPGVDQPPIPGEELPQRYDDRYTYDRAHNDVPKDTYTEREQPKETERRNFNRDDSREEQPEKARERRYDRYSRTPTRQVCASPRKSRDRERDHHDNLDKHRRRKHDASPDKDRKEDRHERKRDNSDDDKAKKSKEKKKKREKKESERKKRKEKKERREQDKLKKEEKEKKHKEKENSVEPQKESKDVEKEHESREVDVRKGDPKINAESPEKVHYASKPSIVEDKPDLYGDLLSEGIDTAIVKNYGKLEDIKEEAQRDSTTPEREINKHDESVEDDSKEEGEYPPESETSKDDDVLDIHANEAELKAELEKTDILAPLPEKSKWEIEEESTPTATESSRYEGKSEKFGKVTNEVIKRAENAIFAKAINAIRPIEIKKISLDRAKLYSGEKDREKDKKVDEHDPRAMQVTILGGIYEDDIHPPGTEPIKIESEIQKPPQRLSVKERLGCKVDDLDRIVRVSYDRNRSRSLSPLSKRAREDRPYVDRRLELDDRRRDDRSRHDRDRHHRNYRNIDRNDARDTRRRDDYSRRDREKDVRERRDDHRHDDKKEHSRSHGYSREDDKSKRKRSRSKSDSRDHKHKKKDKKQKKERSKKHRKDDDEKPNEIKTEKRESSVKPKSATDRRKPTLDEASFEPDYDLDTESEKEDNKKEKKRSRSKSPEEDPKKRLKIEEKEKKETSSSESSESSSDDEKKRKKHRKHKKKKSKKESSSSSSSSDSDSSDDEKERKRRKHKKKQKKRKKSKHK